MVSAVGAPAAALAVVTVTHSPGEALDRFLGSVKAATAGPSPVLLADLGSTDGAPERAVERDGVTVLRLGEVVSWAAAVNRAVAELGEGVDWVAVADPDVEWGEGSIDELLAAAARHPRAGVLGPALVTPDGVVVPSAFALPSALDVLRDRTEVSLPGDGPVGWLAGPCLLLRRAAWESVDGFDARHPRPFDVIDHADRLARAGWLAVAVSTAAVTITTRPPTPAAEGARRYLTSRLRGPARTAAGLVLRARCAFR